MKIAVLHHHLNRGGVTQVIRNHLQALRKAGSQIELSEVIVLHGGRTDGWIHQASETGGFPVRLAAVKGLDYDDQPELHIDELATEIARTLSSAGFAAEETILHVHNHSLGKGVSLPGALRQLAASGFRLLLQIHDFAEDLRPANIENLARALDSPDGTKVGPYLYPNAEHIHYALLNSRDVEVLAGTGINANRVHLLPNPVTGAISMPPHEQALKRFQKAHGLRDSQRVVIYPVRGIRRKNLGELLLWAAVADEQTVFAVTLPATSDVEVPAYRRWRRLAKELDLRLLFDVGLNDGLTFEENLAAASLIITTSVAEGFGLVFLESWLNQRPLVGRNLPEITGDFRDRGVNLDHLGDSLQIPMDWINEDEFVHDLLALHRELCAAYGRTMPSTTESVLRDRLALGHVDFAALPTKQQVEVIERASRSRQSGSAILELNPWMSTSLEIPGEKWQPLIYRNAEAVRNGFSLDVAAKDLATVYRTVYASHSKDAVVTVPRPENILNAFLDVGRLCPVRIEP